jgi:hypothetical protein
MHSFKMSLTLNLGSTTNTSALHLVVAGYFDGYVACNSYFLLIKHPDGSSVAYSKCVRMDGHFCATSLLPFCPYIIIVSCFLSPCNIYILYISLVL